MLFPSPSPSKGQRKTRAAVQRRIRALAICIIQFWLSVHEGVGQTRLQDILSRDSVTVLITDSGLGGLAVAAEVDSLARATRRYRYLEIVFCNALPESDYGYSSMTTSEERTQVFSAALDGMMNVFTPDAVLIACNTLSVVYPLTSLSRRPVVPVIDIVGLGVDMMEEYLRSDVTSVALLFGTEITIRAGDHARMLMQRGIRADRIVTQACGELASEIQLDATSDMTGSMIDFFVQEALAKVSTTSGTILAGLYCTHYGYRSDVFSASLMTKGVRKARIINPNQRMSRLLFPRNDARTFEVSRTRTSVYSRAELTDEEIRSIGTLVGTTSPEAAVALSMYSLKKDLFEFRRRGSDTRRGDTK